jgi:hypothetical protein
MFAIQYATQSITCRSCCSSHGSRWSVMALPSGPHRGRPRYDRPQHDFPGRGTSRAIDVRTIDRHPLASVGRLVLGLRCAQDCPAGAALIVAIFGKTFRLGPYAHERHRLPALRASRQIRRGLVRHLSGNAVRRVWVPPRRSLVSKFTVHVGLVQFKSCRVASWDLRRHCPERQASFYQRHPRTNLDNPPERSRCSAVSLDGHPTSPKPQSRMGGLFLSHSGHSRCRLGKISVLGIPNW